MHMEDLPDDYEEAPKGPPVDSRRRTVLDQALLAPLNTPPSEG